MFNSFIKSTVSKGKNLYSFNKLNLSYFLNTNIENFNDKYVELRSDTKTLPSKKMRESVQTAIFGDDLLGEDPTVNKLCKQMTELFGKERALFVPTGTMSNLISLALFTPRGNYVLQGERAHLNKLENGGQVQMGFKPYPIKAFDDVKENFNLEAILKAHDQNINLDSFAKSVNVLAFENTLNYNGGKIINTEIVSKFVIPSIRKSPCFSHLKFHLDGSRVLNAAAALKVDPKTLVAPYDTINICLSKGLGAPCGSIILLNDCDYERARDIRRNVGGAMRQAGFIAAPALVGFEDWRARFDVDHQNAKILAEGLSKIKGLNVPTPDSNIINIYLDENFIKKDKIKPIIEKLEREYKILLMSFDGNNYIRAVTHYQISKEKIYYAVECFEKVISSFL